LILPAVSPTKRGALFEVYRKHYGKAGDPILVWQAPTLTMNPTASRDEIDKEIEADPAKARAEILCGISQRHRSFYFARNGRAFSHSWSA
jgi:hypothetical protein